MARIIRLHGHGHDEVKDLLPWYVTGQLEPGERAAVERHLQVCVDCQTDVRFQRRLDAEMDELALDVEQGWREMQRRVERHRARRSWLQGWRLDGWSLAGWSGAGALRWSHAASWLGGMAATIVVVTAVATWWRPVPAYHALGARTAAPAANMIVVFRPDTAERDIRGALRAADARLVGGPTEADAYLLEAPLSERTAALTKLRASRSVVLAEAIDTEPRP
jgi:hypothetical protein